MEKERPECEAEHSSEASVEIKILCSSKSALPYIFMMWSLGIGPERVTPTATPFPWHHTPFPTFLPLPVCHNLTHINGDPVATSKAAPAVAEEVKRDCAYWTLLWVPRGELHTPAGFCVFCGPFKGYSSSYFLIHCLYWHRLPHFLRGSVRIKPLHTWKLNRPTLFNSENVSNMLLRNVGSTVRISNSKVNINKEPMGKSNIFTEKNLSFVINHICLVIIFMMFNSIP